MPENALADPALKGLLEAINDSYNAYERDKELSDRAFRISEEEYIEINQQLKFENDVKKQSLQKLKNTLGLMTGENSAQQSDDLLLISDYLGKQVNDRKSAELIFTSLVTNLQNGILLEDETRHIVFANQRFCDFFGIPVSPANLQGMDCSNSAEQSKGLFKDPEAFVDGIITLLDNKKLVTGEILELADDRIFQRDYIPIFLDNEYKGHLWSYTDITEKRRVQNEIAKREQINRLILNASLDAIVIINHEGLINFWNPQAEKIFGWKEKEAIGKRLSDTIIPLHFRSAHNQGMHHFNTTGEGPALNKILELTAINKKGMEFPVELSIIPVKQSEGMFFCGFIRDISERKKAEADLKESQELWRFALEGTGDGVWEYDFETEDVFFSKQYKKMLGYEDDEFVNDPKEWRSRIHPDDIPIIDQTDLDYQNKIITSHQREYRIQHRNGQYIWILDRGMILSYTDSGLPKRIIGTHSDITERKVSEQAIRINEEKYRSIIANMNLGLMEVDLNEVILYANQSFCDMSGYHLDDLVGQRASRLFVRGENHEFMEVKNNMRKKGITDAYELSIKNKRGELKWWLISGAPKYNDQGELVGSIGIHLDITEQKMLELDLIEAREQAEQSANAKQTFLANMSHEIRTPMNAILGMSRQLQKTELTDLQHTYLQAISNSGENLMVVINDILDISKIEAGKLTLESIGFRLTDMVKRAMQVIQFRAEEKGLQIISEIDENISDVLLGDPFRLNQVLLNLLSNAVKFSEKGSIRIHCRLMLREKDRELIEFVIADNGIGMEKEFLNNLFKSFTQEDRSVSRKYGGTGLGMAITKQLAELMGGTIRVQSVKNKGTTVTILIPFLKGTEKDMPLQEQQSSDIGLLKGKRILLVEDNEMNRLVATTTLDNYEPIITEVVNGQEAIDVLKEQEFDVILMDMQMPVLDGLEATKIIRNDLRLTIPVIALTANAIKGESIKCLEAGMNDYISKPFEEVDLVNMLAKWLGKEALKKNPPPVMEKETLYDLSKLHEIGKGNNAFVHKMVNLFIDQIPLSLSEIDNGLQTGDLDKVKAVAHRIKPSIDNLGIGSLKTVVRQVEMIAGEKQDSPELHALIKQMNNTLERVIVQLKTELA